MTITRQTDARSDLAAANGKCPRDRATEPVEALAVKDDHLVYRSCTRGFAKALGFASPAEIIGKTDFDLLPRDLAREELVLDSRVMSTSQADISAYVLPLAGHQAILVRTPLLDNEQRVRGIDLRLLFNPSPVSSREVQPVADYRALVSEGLQGSIIIGDNAVLFANGNAALTLGYDTADSLTQLGRVDSLFERAERQRIAQASVRAHKNDGRLVVTAHAREGRKLRLLARATRVVWDAREATLLSFIDAVLPARFFRQSGDDESGAGQSVRKRRSRSLDSPAADAMQLLKRVRANELRLSHFAHAGADFFWELDADLVFRFFSAETDAVLGLARESLVGREHRELREHPASLDPASHWEANVQQLATHQPFRDVEFRWRAGEEEKVIRYSGLPVFDALGSFAGYRGTGCDVTAMVRQAELAAYHASHDNLTELYNRRFFEELVRDALDSVRMRRQNHVLCYLDLDNFKIVNDTSGHSAGDELLRQLARHVDDRVRAADAFARIGGDEFGILLRDCTLADALTFVNQLRSEVEHFQFLWQEHRFRVGVSIGLVAIDERWESCDELFEAVDTACYQAKNEGRNRVVVYRDDRETDDARTTQRRASTQWVNEIQSALDDDRLQLACQKLEPMEQGVDLAWYEMLLRLQRDSGEWIAPGAFLPNAERYGLSSALDERAVELAIQWLQSRRLINGSAVLCSINLSPSSLSEETFASRLCDKINASGVAPAQLCFEITECATVSHLSAVTSFMETMTAIGCRFCIDGFGSGLSSFIWLKRLPVDFVKVDSALMRGVLDDETQQKLVRAVIEISQSMGKKTVAGFVDTPELLGLFRELGADYVQGFHVAEPRLMAR